MTIDELIDILKNSDIGNETNNLKLTQKQYEELMEEVPEALKGLKAFNGPFGKVNLEIIDEKN